MSMFKSGSTHAVVKFYNAKRSFGFATSSEGDLHIPASPAYDFRNDLVPGARLQVEYRTAKEGLQISKIIEVLPPAPADFHEGEVKFFNTEKGFGFIVSDAFEKDVLLHGSVAERVGVVPWTGLRLEFSVKERNGKFSATEIRPVSEEVASKKPKRGATRGTSHLQVEEGASMH